jgi:hypothetical protein
MFPRRLAYIISLRKVCDLLLIKKKIRSGFFRRLLGKILRELSGVFDSFSFYFSILPRKIRMKEIACFALIGENADVVSARLPTPQFVEIGEKSKISKLLLARGKYCLVESDVRADLVSSPTHIILTCTKKYEGKEIQRKFITFSVDFEAGVGLSHADKEDWETYRRYWDSGSSVERLAEVFKRHEIPVTWAVCGHLFLENCSGDHGFQEKDWFGDWLKFDPKSDHITNPSWYYPNLIRQLSAEPLYDIGYHSFGHFKYNRCSKETVLREIQIVKNIRMDWQIDMNTMVFPYNRCGHLDILSKEGGFEFFRGNIGRNYPAYGAIDFGDYVFFNTTQMVTPENIEICQKQLELLPNKNFNYYTHCYQWQNKNEIECLDRWLGHVINVCRNGAVEIIIMSQVGKSERISEKTI